MKTGKKKFYIPDVYIGFLILPVIGIIAILAEILLDPILWFLKLLHH